MKNYQADLEINPKDKRNGSKFKKKKRNGPTDD